VTLAVIVASRRYFVDIYDLSLFGWFRHGRRCPTLACQGELLCTPKTGVYLINMQMGGMLVAGSCGASSATTGAAVRAFRSTRCNRLGEHRAMASSNGFDGYVVPACFAGIGSAGELAPSSQLVSELMASTTAVRHDLVAALASRAACARSSVGAARSSNLAWCTGATRTLVSRGWAAPAARSAGRRRRVAAVSTRFRDERVARQLSRCLFRFRRSSAIDPRIIHRDPVL